MKGERRILSTQFQSNLAARLNDVAYGRQVLVITRHSTPMAALISIEDYEHFRRLLRDERLAMGPGGGEDHDEGR